MKTIPLIGGGEALVSDCDYHVLSNLTWRKTPYGYAFLRTRPFQWCKSRFMHRVIMTVKTKFQISDDLVVDHIDGNRLNNQRDNLRLATPIQNMWNSKAATWCYMGLKGVKRRCNGLAFDAELSVKGIRYFVGRFNTPWEAAIAWNIAAEKFQGEFARLNSPQSIMAAGAPPDFLNHTTEALVREPFVIRKTSAFYRKKSVRPKTEERQSKPKGTASTKAKESLWVVDYREGRKIIFKLKNSS